MIPILINDVPVDCINKAALQYHVPAPLILSVIKTEGGRNGMAKKNKNGTVDYGVMQINSVWLGKIKPYGFTAHDLQFNPCKNVEVGAWILSQNMASSSSAKEGIGNYHSRTQHLNKNYHQKVTNTYHSINKTING